VTEGQTDVEGICNFHCNLFWWNYLFMWFWQPIRNKLPCLYFYNLKYVTSGTFCCAFQVTRPQEVLRSISCYSPLQMGTFLQNDIALFVARFTALSKSSDWCYSSQLTESFKRELWQRIITLVLICVMGVWKWSVVL